MVLVLVKLPKGEMFISTNELHLSLVIESLFDNTNKFTDSGSVTLKIKLDKAQSKLRIEVTDTGCGMKVCRNTRCAFFFFIDYKNRLIFLSCDILRISLVYVFATSK